MPTDTPAHQALQACLHHLLQEVLDHDGYGSIRIDVRLLKRGQKEVIVECGKQYRFVVDHAPKTAQEGASFGMRP